MLDLRPVLWIVGVLLSLLACAMTLPVAADLIAGNSDWTVFAGSAAITLFVGQGLMFAHHDRRQGIVAQGLTLRQSLLAPVLGWLSCAVVAACPFAFSHLGLSATDALFEAISGVTATGATVLRDLETLPPGILLWRSLLQWLGGAGALTLGGILLPALQVGGMQIFRLDTSGRDERMTARANRILTSILAFYAGATLILAVLLNVAGMSGFDALNHALTTISCGGFSTADGSIRHWHTAAIEWIVMVGMLIGGAPFMVHLQVLSRNWRQGLANTQLRSYAALLLSAGFLMAAWLMAVQGAKPLPALRHGLFAAISVMTGTGFATRDWGTWIGSPTAVLLLLTIVGGCAGSTAGGIKVFRLQILLSSAAAQVGRLLWPNSVVPSRYEGVPIPDTVAESVLGFLFVFVFAFGVLSLGLAMTGLDFGSALSAAAAALANLGPGLTVAVGPMTGYGQVTDFAKWMLSAGMLFGRLEMFLVLALFTKDFWRE